MYDNSPIETRPTKSRNVILGPGPIGNSVLRTKPSFVTKFVDFGFGSGARMKRALDTRILKERPSLFAYLHPRLVGVPITPFMKEASAGFEHVVRFRNTTCQSDIRYKIRARITPSKLLPANGSRAPSPA